MTDLETWVHDNTDTFYRISRYKRLYTPYEQEKKYSDEDIYEETYQGKITGVIDTGNDKLLEIEEWYEDYTGEEKKMGTTHYELLSNIIIERWDSPEEE